MPHRGFIVHREGLGYRHVVQLAKGLLSTESLGSTHSGNDFFCERTSLSDVLQGKPKDSEPNIDCKKGEQRLLHIGRDEFVHDATGDSDTWQNGGQCQSETP